MLCLGVQVGLVMRCTFSWFGESGMDNLYYVAAWTDSDCLCCCEHEHQNVACAVACISTCGGFVLAFEDAQMRGLNGKEMAEFNQAMFGRPGVRKDRLPNGLLSLLFVP